MFCVHTPTWFRVRDLAHGMTVATAGEEVKDVKKLEEELQVAQTEIVKAKEKLGCL